MNTTTFFKYQHFIERLSSVTKSEKRAYIVESNDALYYHRTSDKPNKFKTQEIIDTARNSLNFIKNEHPGISLELRVKLIGDLNHALDAYAKRISKKVESRWWYFIMRFFGCPKCPATLTSLQQKSQSTLLLLTQKKEEKEAERKRRIQRKIPVIIKHLKKITKHSQKKRSIAINKACEKLKSILQRIRREREQRIRIESERARAEAVRVIQAEQSQLSILRQEEERQGKLNELRVECEQELQKIRKVCDPEPLEGPENPKKHWDKLLGEGDVRFVPLNSLSFGDLISMKIVSKSTSNLVQAFFELNNKNRLTEEEIALWVDNPQREEYQYICAQELDEINEKEEAEKLGISAEEIETSKKGLKTLIDEAEIRRLGFTEEDIKAAKEKNGGLRKLIQKAKEAERCLKFCRYLPGVEKILRKIVDEYFPDKEKNEQVYECRIDDFNLTEEELTEKELEEESKLGYKEKQKLRKRKDRGSPRLGGQNLLEAAEMVRNFMLTEEIQKIKTLTVQWIAGGYWHNHKATQLDTLPLAINLLKGLTELTLLDHNMRCCKKLPPLNLPNLEKLIVRATDIRKLPIMHVPNLKECELSSNLISDMPSFRGNFDQLSSLLFHSSSYHIESDRRLRRWSEAAKLPSNLVRLTISGSRLRTLPNSIGNLYNLRTLDIFQSSEPIPKRDSYEESSLKDIWSEGDFEIHQTWRQNSYRHDIASIPPGIMFLKNLEVLELNQCELSERTPGLKWIALLQNLNKLDLRYNPLYSLPEGFKLLPKDCSKLFKD